MGWTFVGLKYGGRGDGGEHHSVLIELRGCLPEVAE